MVERATAVQAAQIGVETTAGTAVTASKRLLSVGFKQGIKVDTKAEMSQGFKLPTAVSIGKDWTEGTFDGYAGYNDLAYLLSSVLLDVTPSGAGGRSLHRPPRAAHSIVDGSHRATGLLP